MEVPALQAEIAGDHATAAALRSTAYEALSEAMSRRAVSRPASPSRSSPSAPNDPLRVRGQRWGFDGLEAPSDWQGPGSGPRSTSPPPGSGPNRGVGPRGSKSMGVMGTGVRGGKALDGAMRVTGRSAPPSGRAPKALPRRKGSDEGDGALLQPLDLDLFPGVEVVGESGAPVFPEAYTPPVTPVTGVSRLAAGVGAMGAKGAGAGQAGAGGSGLPNPGRGASEAPVTRVRWGGCGGGWGGWVVSR